MTNEDFLALYNDRDHTLIVGWDGGSWTGMWAAKAEEAQQAHPTPDTAVLDVFKTMLDLAIERGLCSPPIDTTGWESW